MPQRRSGPTGTTVSQLQNGRTRRTDFRDGGTSPAECLAPNCTEQPLDDAPVALCGKHTREVWQFAQGLIEDRWLNAAVASIQ